MFKIQKGIEYPEFAREKLPVGKKRERFVDWKGMEVGDCFLIPIIELGEKDRVVLIRRVQKAVANVNQRYHGQIWSMRQTFHNGAEVIGVWRIF